MQALGTTVLKQASLSEKPSVISDHTSLSTDEIFTAPGQDGCPRINLSNDIHPIFGDERYIDGIQPSVVRPVMRLVSRFLLTDACLLYMHTCFFGESTPVTNITQYGCESSDHHASVELRDVAGKLTPEQTLRTKQALVEIAARISIGLYEDDVGPMGYTEHPYNETGARITFSRYMYNNLAQSAEVERWNDHSWMTVQSAVILIHELAHAIPLLARGALHFFFNNGAIQEEGFELENRLFGGEIDLVTHPGAAPGSITGLGCNTSDTKIRLMPCLDADRVNGYVEIGTCFSIRGDGKALRREHSFPIVPFSYVEALLQDHFWETEVPARGADALKPRCDGMFRFTRPTTKAERMKAAFKGWVEARRCRKAAAKAARA